eukprot:TRINITY_DN659_c0_g1_i2.p1 TRINITY_DN659_c0_g1~~TRINITY_DN659_c0_g1_i2.p1  ORF type:complete len:704 (-),score=239.29 TRINITY_DN659_c0_g1_i2:108-2219(-)
MKTAMRAFLLACFAGNALVEAQRQYPVSKVVELLQNMGKELADDAEKDEDMDGKMRCWCKKNRAEKEKQIGTAEKDTIPGLENNIATKKLEIQTLTSEIETAEDNLDAANTTLKSATENRENRKAKFDERSGELKKNVKGLREAEARVKNIGRFADPNIAFLGMGTSSESSWHNVQGIVSEVRRMHDDYYKKRESDEGMKLLLLDQSDKLKQLSERQAPAEAEKEVVHNDILAIFKEMGISMKKDLKQVQKDEANEIKTFTEMSQAKKQEMLIGKKTIATKEQKSAEAEEVKATKEGELSDEEALLATNQKFYADINERCDQHDKDYAERVTTRNEEIAGVAKAVSILSADDARETFGRTFNGGESFLQLSAQKDQKAKQEKIANLLVKASASTNDAKLARLAETIKRQPGKTFKSVIVALDAMMEELETKKKDEADTKETCDKNYAQNADDTDKNTLEKNENTAEATKLKAKIAELTSEVQTLTEEIAQNNQDLKEAGEARENEHTASLAAVKDQQATQELLTKAKETLEGIGYSASFVQEKTTKTVRKISAGQAPSEAPEGLSDYSLKASGGVMTLLTQVLTDSENLEKETVAAEEAAKKAYETFKADTEASIEEAQRNVLDKNTEKGKSEEELNTAESNIANANEMLESLKKGYQALEDECRYLITNFDFRQGAYQQEIDALKQAKNYIADFEGKDPGAR